MTRNTDTHDRDPAARDSVPNVSDARASDPRLPAAGPEIEFPYTLTLLREHTFNGETFTEITFREPTGQDYLHVSKIKDPTQARLAALVELAELDMKPDQVSAFIRSLNFRDFAQCLDVAGFFIETVSMSEISYESLLTSPAILEAVRNST